MNTITAAVPNSGQQKALAIKAAGTSPAARSRSAMKCTSAATSANAASAATSGLPRPPHPRSARAPSPSPGARAPPPRRRRSAHRQAIPGPPQVQKRDGSEDDRRPVAPGLAISLDDRELRRRATVLRSHRDRGSGRRRRAAPRPRAEPAVGGDVEPRGEIVEAGPGQDFLTSEPGTTANPFGRSTTASAAAGWGRPHPRQSRVHVGDQRRAALRLAERGGEIAALSAHAVQVAARLLRSSARRAAAAAIHAGSATGRPGREGVSERLLGGAVVAGSAAPWPPRWRCAGPATARSPT